MSIPQIIAGRKPVTALGKLASYSAEIFPPGNTSSSAEFEQSIRTLCNDERLAFLSFGCKKPFVDSTHAVRCAEAQIKEYSHIPLVVNVTCRRMNSDLVKRTFSTFAKIGVQHVCVLSGGGPAQEDDMFRHPTDMLQWMKGEGISMSTIAVAGNPLKGADDWNYVKQKIQLGANLVLPTPTLDHSLLTSWLTQSQQEIPTTLAVPTIVAPVSPKTLEKILARGTIRLPRELEAPLRMGLLPPHPAANMDEEEWDANSSRIFMREMKKWELLFLQNVLLGSNASHCHFVQYGRDTELLRSVVEGASKI